MDVGLLCCNAAWTCKVDINVLQEHATLQPGRWRQYVVPKRWKPRRQHTISTAVRNSKLAQE
jgi:hypothetical protein